MAGRIMSRRIMGAASFSELMDSTGRMQLYFKRDEICPDEDKTMYNIVFKRLLDIGDFIGIKGGVFKTGKGEFTLRALEFEFLSKNIKPLPDKFHGLTDVETRYRQRYVDLIMNREVKDTFIKRTKIISHIRKMLTEKDILEV